MSILDESRMKPYLSEKLRAEALSITSIWKNLEGWSMETYSLGLSYRRDGRQVEQDIIIRKAPEIGQPAERDAEGTAPRVVDSDVGELRVDFEHVLADDRLQVARFATRETDATSEDQALAGR